MKWGNSRRKKWFLGIIIALWFAGSVFTLVISLENRKLSGPQGSQGSQGSQGIQGVVGEKGETGYRGHRGWRGLRGPTGYMGIIGLQGEKGERGDIGLRGEKGDTWYNDLPKLYKQTSPAVVWIGAEYNDDDFHSAPWKEISERDENVPITIKWQGSGFLVSANGLIATAGHVTEDTESFVIQFQDGTRGKAEFVHMEKMERCDVGFLQITWIDKYLDEDEFHILLMKSEPIKNLPYFNFDTKVEIGESLIILGYPWGLNNGVALTQGVVCLPNREEPFFGVKLVVQTDVASYPGNSGSPVIDMDGECIGILIGGMRGCDNFSIVTPARLVELAMQKALAEIELREIK